jgi:predicted metal-dependent HD superfamily phosphohydrolase
MFEQRFVALWEAAGSSRGKDNARHIYLELKNRYDEPHRHYHTIDHIRFCLEQVDRIPDEYPHKTAVELALWFHDVIYEIGDPQNERNSAEWFRGRADGDLPDNLVDQVYRMIIATEHRQPPAEGDVAYVVDIDLSSFGRPYDEFLEDSRRVRAESIHLTDEQFSEGQCAFLRNLLARDRIYRSDLFRELYEDQARSNIRRVVDGNA